MIKKFINFLILPLTVFILSIVININGNSYAKYKNFYSDASGESAYIIDKKKKI